MDGYTLIVQSEKRPPRENGKIVTGNNQENAAYPSGMCAERVAVWSVASQYPGIVIKKIAIAVKSSLKQVDKPVSPCGACRQTLLEYEVNQKEPITKQKTTKIKPKRGKE